MSNNIAVQLSADEANAVARELAFWLVLEGDALDHVDFSWTRPSPGSFASVRSQICRMKDASDLLDQLSWIGHHRDPVEVHISPRNALVFAEILDSAGDGHDAEHRHLGEQAKQAARVLAAAFSTMPLAA